MARIAWTSQALGDLQSIREFIARDAPLYAEILVDRLFEVVERLTQFPESGRVVPEIGRQDVREVILGSYRVVYQVNAERVTILTVFHSTRLLGSNDLPQNIWNR